MGKRVAGGDEAGVDALEKPTRIGFGQPDQTNPVSQCLGLRDIAREHRVPVLQAPPLARALYAHTEVDQEIPARLFTAVAQVLAYVFQLRAAVAGKGVMPPDLPPIEVPPDLDPHSAGPAQA